MFAAATRRSVFDASGLAHEVLQRRVVVEMPPVRRHGSARGRGARSTPSSGPLASGALIAASCGSVVRADRDAPRDCQRGGQQGEKRGAFI